MSLLSRVPRKPQRKPIGIETRPGLRSGNQAKSASGISEVGVPETTGEKITRPTAAINPPKMLAQAPAVLNLFQNRLKSNAGRLAEAATAKARATRNAMFNRW